MKKYIATILFLKMMTCLSISYSATRYLLCGPDEDGCPTDGSQYCFCIPYDETEEDKPYCLDFDRMTCESLTQVSHCDSDFIYKNKAQCLATIFQSEPEPSCTLTTFNFCSENDTYFCDKNGHPESCRK